jgi:hypothetical protein
LLLVATAAGCASLNPCGGFTPEDGVADIHGGTLLGKLELVSPSRTTTHSFNSNNGYEKCSTLVSGFAADDGSGTTEVEVLCPEVTVLFTLPDVRPFDRGARTSLATMVTLANESKYAATGSLTIDRAAGGQAPSPAFVSSDFVRAGDIELVPTTAAGDPGLSTPRVTVHAKVELVADDYSQAEQSGVDHCPVIPSK